MHNFRDDKKAIASAMTLISSGGVERIRTSAPVTQPNDLANRPLQPLEYHSIMAERVGFEPTHPFEPTGFQDRTLQPFEYLSISQQIYYSRWSLNLSNDGDCAILSYVATLFRYILKNGATYGDRTHACWSHNPVC